MINYFALTISEMGIGKIELAVIGSIILLFPIMFVYASMNLDTKGIFEWMMEKPNDWIGRKYVFYYFHISNQILIFLNY